MVTDLEIGDMIKVFKGTNGMGNINQGDVGSVIEVVSDGVFLRFENHPKFFLHKLAEIDVHYAVVGRKLSEPKRGILDIEVIRKSNCVTVEVKNVDRVFKEIRVCSDSFIIEFGRSTSLTSRGLLIGSNGTKCEAEFSSNYDAANCANNILSMIDKVVSSITNNIVAKTYDLPNSYQVKNSRCLIGISTNENGVIVAQSEEYDYSEMTDIEYNGFKISIGDELKFINDKHLQLARSPIGSIFCSTSDRIMNTEIIIKLLCKMKSSYVKEFNDGSIIIKKEL